MNGYHTTRMSHILDMNNPTKIPYVLYSIIFPASILIWFNNDVLMLPIIIATLMIMTFIGTQGKNWHRPPCRVNMLCRMIPTQPWYTSKYLNMGIVGIIMFMIWKVMQRNIESPSIEDLMSKKLYTSNHIYLLPLIILMILLSILPLLATVMVYMQLNNEDWRWKWRSIFIAGSVTICPLIHVIQSFQFEINSVINDVILVMGTFVVTASIGFNGANYWVSRMYSRLVCD